STKILSPLPVEERGKIPSYAPVIDELHAIQKDIKDLKDSASQLDKQDQRYQIDKKFTARCHKQKFATPIARVFIGGVTTRLTFTEKRTHVASVKNQFLIIKQACGKSRPQRVVDHRALH
ncbi:MAG: hypothetical protein ABI254_06635, partial [Chthoniobacterales bacterium]